MSFISNLFNPQKELGLAQIGALQGFASNAQAQAANAGNQTSPFDMIFGGLTGAASGAAGFF